MGPWYTLEMSAGKDGSGFLGLAGTFRDSKRLGTPLTTDRTTERMQNSGKPASSSYAEKSDEVLITLFQRGEREVYRILVQRYQERVRNLIYSIFRDPGVVDDLAQEIFIKAYEALPSFRLDSSFYTWLYRITVNKSRDEMRRRKVRRFLSFQTLVDEANAELTSKLSVPPESRDDKEIVALGLQALPEKFRSAIVLKDIEGLSYDEIAAILKCELGTVKSRLSRGRSMLRKILQPLLEEN
ncbi:MAG TPA: sigma-70 family RNA polymerase sigma factor [Bacteroidota bacterium]